MSIIANLKNSRNRQLSAELSESNYQQSATKLVTLEQLFTKAEEYGHVQIYSSNRDKQPNSYRAKIVFNTKANIELEATSDFGLSLKNALHQAIDRAEDIRKEFKE